MKRNASKKGGGNLEGLLMFGDALPPELVAGAKALGMGGMGFAQGLLAEGGNVGADDGGGEKAPDAIDFEDMSDGEVDDFEEDEPEIKKEKEEDAEEVRAKAAEMARTLKSKLAAGAAKKGGDDYDDDYDADSSSLPSFPAAALHANGAAPKPSATTTTTTMPTAAAAAPPAATTVFASPLPIKQEPHVDAGGMGLDEMEKALFSDEDEEEPSEMDEESSSQLSRDSMPPPASAAAAAAAPVDSGPVLPPAIAAVLSGNAIVLTPSVKHICSSLYNGMGGPILKFSEIFAPRRPNRRSRLRQAARARARAAAAAAASASAGQIEEEEDEEDLFNTLSYTFYLPKEEVGEDDEYEEAGETGVVPLPTATAATTKSADLSVDAVGEMKRKKKQLREGVSFVSIPSPVHEAVQTWPWEDEIIWDEDSTNTAAKAQLTEPVPQQSVVVLRASVSESELVGTKAAVAVSPPLAAAKAGQWGAVDQSAKPAAAPAESSTATSEVLEQLEAEPIVEPREWSLFPAVNEDLASGDWLDAVIWDDRKVPSAAANNPLIFDLNDKEMLFEENVKKPLEDEEQMIGAEEEGVKKVERRRGRRPKRKISEIASIIEDEVEEDLDPFNYSLDRIYANASRALAKIRPKNMGKPVVQHSIPALKLSSFKTNFAPEDLRLFHRPRTRLPTSKKIKVTPAPIEGSRTNPRFKKQSGTIRRKRELSGKDGRVVLAEYLEERPPVLSNVGMGTKILNYYRKKDINDIPPDKTREDGDMVLLDQADECPFLGEVPTGDTVQMMDNNLFRAPIVKHNAPTTDFLLVRSKNKFYIREIPAVYAVGQEQPVAEVPAPNSRSANNFIKARLQTFIYRLFKKRANQQRVRISDICSAFPSHSETSIRKRLKDCSDFQRGGDDSGWWTLKKDFEMPSEEDLRAMLTPETVCAYESMLAGHQRLQDCGIEHTHNATGLSQAVAQLEAESGKKHKAAAAFVKEEVYLAPWNTTGNFLSVQNGKGQLQLTGFGDPTGTGAGFSYLRVPQKVQAQQKKAQVPKTSVTGTDADLRKLSLENARLVLLKFGVSEDIIEKLGRWERIDLVREKSSAAAAGGDDPNLTKFARGRRFNFQQQQQVYKDECARIFEKQLAFLSELNPDDISDDEEDLQDNIELQDFAGEMERELEALFGGDDSNSEAPELPPPKPARGARPSVGAGGGPRALARKRTLAQQEADEEEAERRELQKFMEEAREKKREEALAAQAAATPVRPAAVAAAAPVARPVTPVSLAPVTAAAESKREPFSPFSDSSLDGFPSASEGGVPGGSPRGPSEGAGGGGELKKPTRKFIKRTVTKKGPDGQPIKVVEIIRDPKKVEEYMKKSKAAKKNRPKLTAEEEAEKQRVRKEKRRLQEQLRRLKKNREKQRILAERLAEGNRDGTLSQTEGTNNQLVCGACGMVGHMRTNRNCPYYTEDQAAGAGATAKGTGGGPRKGKRRRRNVDYDEDDDDEDELDFDLDDEDLLLDEDLDEPLLLDELLAQEEAELAAKIAPLVKVEGTKLRFPKVVLAAVTPTAGSTPTTSIPASPISVVDVVSPPSAAPPTTIVEPAAPAPGGSSRRPSKRPKLEPTTPRTPAPAAPSSAATTPSPTAPPAPSRSAATTPTSGGQVVTTPAESPATPGGGEKKLILRISKKDLPPGALTRKRPVSELSEPNYMLNPPKLPRVRSRKTGRGAGVQLAAIFEKAMLRVKSHEYAPPFLRPVTTKEAPDYHKYIKKPIDLGTIHNNVKAFKYLSQNALLADMKLMASNCHKYCDVRFPQLPPLADTLVKICIEALRENETEIQELEALIGAQGEGEGDTPVPATPASASSRSRSSGGAHKSASASTPYTPKSSSSASASSSSGGHSSRPSSKTSSRSGTPRSTTPSSSVPASPSASFHFSSSPSSPVHSSSVPRVTSTAGSTKVKIKLPVKLLRKDD